MSSFAQAHANARIDGLPAIVTQGSVVRFLACIASAKPMRLEHYARSEAAVPGGSCTASIEDTGGRPMLAVPSPTYFMNPELDAT
nr:hypothetical protein CFP56_20290 [Quercus suber]